MVLADTKWESKANFIYPRTKSVTGLCNSNVVDKESKWKWKACPKSKNIPFSDLWFAVRGGGGGTYGIVTAVQVQLHDFHSIFYIYRDDSVLNQVYEYCADIDCTGLIYLVLDFLVDLFWQPKSLGLSEATSNSCGSPGIRFATFFVIDRSDGNYFLCEGSSARDAVIAACKTYVNSTILPSYPGVPIEKFIISLEIGS